MFRSGNTLPKVTPAHQDVTFCNAHFSGRENRKKKIKKNKSKKNKNEISKIKK
jgi:hypothetical protein